MLYNGHILHLLRPQKGTHLAQRRDGKAGGLSVEEKKNG
jgi:hypothetical protein